MFNNYRNQWNTVASPYVTLSSSVDMPVYRNNGNFLALGLNLFSDQTGDAQVNTFQYTMALAYSLDLNGDGTHYFSLGLQGGQFRRKINLSTLYFDNQWVGVGFDKSIDNLEDLPFDRITAIEVGAGLHWFYAPTDLTEIWLGASGQHLTEPDISFNSGDEKLMRKISVHGGADIDFANSNVAIIPNFIYVTQGPNQIINVGSDVRFVLVDRSELLKFRDEFSWNLGIYNRFGDAFFATTRFSYSNFALGVSYDFNTSDLKTASGGKGGMEFLLSYFGSFNGGGKRNARFL